MQFAWSWPKESSERSRLGSEIARTLKVPDPIGHVLANRGLDASAVESIGSSSLLKATEAMGSPANVDRAAEKLLAAARRGRIGILCDYDVDGATAQAILVESVRALELGPDREPVVAVPERNTEGFGPNVRCLNQLASQGASCVAVLDCGTAAGPLLDRFAKTTGIETVVVDHHPPHGDAPPASASIVNPWVGDEADPGEHGTLCAAGLTWFVARSIVRQAGLTAADTVDLRRRITLLAALGTSCDVMRIDTPFNRNLVRTGVRLLDEPRARVPGLSSLHKIADVRSPGKAADFGWRIGPRLNAGSRMGESDLASQCLRTTKPRKASELAKRLDAHNAARRDLSDKANREIRSSHDLASLEEGPVNLCVVESATPGTAGLVASTLTKQYGWPAIVVTRRDGDVLAGSGRSTLDFDIGSAVSAARHEGLVTSGGGHAAACGLELERTRLDELRSYLEGRFQQHAATTSGPTRPTHQIDAELKANWLSPESQLGIAEEQLRLEPWGQGLKLPLFGARNCLLARPPRFHKGHVFLDLESGGTSFKAVWWGVPADWRERVGAARGGGPAGREVSSPRIEIVGRIGLDEWKGRRNGRFEVTDARVRER